MLMFKMLKKDFLRKPSIFIVIFIFITLSGLLMSNGASLIVQLTSSLDIFFAKAKTPHFVQMHSGALSKSKLEFWSQNNSKVEEYQLLEMISIPGNKLFWGDKHEVLENSVMDISFVEQNEKFDYLLNLNNQVIKVSAGQIAIPIYFKEKFALKKGDRLTLHSENQNIDFEIVSFIRDSQMNPAIIHSKRFLISNEDKEIVSKIFPEKEYLIEYRLKNLADLGDFEGEYQASGLPMNGPSLNINLFKLLNSLSDGIVAGLVIILSLLIMLVAILCLRFVILSSLEEDLREIGVMKAIGLPLRRIKNIYNYKYLGMSYLALLTGYGLSLITNDFLLDNILLYTGQVPTNWQTIFLPFLAANLIIFFIALSLRIIIRKIGKISSVEAINMSRKSGKVSSFSFLSLQANKLWNLDLFLALREILIKFKLYWLLLVIFIFAVFIILVPYNIYYTVSSPNFITYMGIGQSDLRIDLRNSLTVKDQFSNLGQALASDDDIAEYSKLVTSKYELILADESRESVAIESGNSKDFPLSYLQGQAPSKDSEISLSFLNSQELNKGLNDSLRLVINDQEKLLKITGIYQDITNGGKSAKALFDYDSENVLWYTILLNVKAGVNIQDKLKEYKTLVPSARVTDISGYLQQTFGSTIRAIKQVAIIAGMAGLFISLFISLLFLKMMINKDMASLAIMMSQGFSKRSIQMQYIYRTFFLLVSGLLFGILLTYSLGQRIISLFSAMLGIAKFSFEYNPLFLFVILPLTLIIAVVLTTIISLKSLSNENLINRITQ